MNSNDEIEDDLPRMSFLEHLEDLRAKTIRMLIGVALAFAASLNFSRDLWKIVSAPAVDALTRLGYKGPTGGPPELFFSYPTEVFSIVWIKLPVLSAVFLASPWILYQVWSFIAPGLYRHERRWAAPFVCCSAGLFILGGVFGYFVAFRQGLTFLLGLGRDNNITPIVSVTDYFDLFVNVMLGFGLAFEVPVLVFFLALLRLADSRTLLAQSRYAILGIVILAAIVTPTPDIFNLMLVVVPMCALFFAGVLGAYLLERHRARRKLRWRAAVPWTATLLALAAAAYVAITRFGLRLRPQWRFFTR